MREQPTGKEFTRELVVERQLIGSLWVCNVEDVRQIPGRNRRQREVSPLKVLDWITEKRQQTQVRHRQGIHVADEQVLPILIRRSGQRGVQDGVPERNQLLLLMGAERRLSCLYRRRDKCLILSEGLGIEAIHSVHKSVQLRRQTAEPLIPTLRYRIGNGDRKYL